MPLPTKRTVNWNERLACVGGRSLESSFVLEEYKGDQEPVTAD